MGVVTPDRVATIAATVASLSLVVPVIVLASTGSAGALRPEDNLALPGLSFPKGRAAGHILGRRLVLGDGRRNRCCGLRSPRKQLS